MIIYNDFKINEGALCLRTIKPYFTYVIQTILFESKVNVLCILELSIYGFPHIYL